MVPRISVFALDINNFDDAALDRAVDAGYSRIPCYENNKDNIVGLVYLKDILLAARNNKQIDVRTIMRPIIAVPETKSIGALLKEFQMKHQQIALVVNEYGGTEGIITMEDILEELVGEIQDEYDNEIPFVEMVGDKTYHIQASAGLDDINELLPHSLKEDEQYETLAGYLMLKFGKIPGLKEKIVCDGYEFSVLKKNKSTIVLVQATDLSAE